MKVLIILVAFFALASSEHKCTDRTKFLEYRQQCATANGVTDEQIEKLKTYQFDFESENVYCHVKCIFEKMDLFAEDKFLVDNVVHQLHHGTKDLDDTVIKGDLEHCIEEFKSESDKCKFAFDVLKCFKAKNPKNIDYLKQSFVPHDHGHSHDHAHDHSHHH